MPFFLIVSDGKKNNEHSISRSRFYLFGTGEHCDILLPKKDTTSTFDEEQFKLYFDPSYKRWKLQIIGNSSNVFVDGKQVSQKKKVLRLSSVIKFENFYFKLKYVRSSDIDTSSIRNTHSDMDAVDNGAGEIAQLMNNEKTDQTHKKSSEANTPKNEKNTKNVASKFNKEAAWDIEDEQTEPNSKDDMEDVQEKESIQKVSRIKNIPKATDPSNSSIPASEEEHILVVDKKHKNEIKQAESIDMMNKNLNKGNELNAEKTSIYHFDNNTHNSRESNVINKKSNDPMTDAIDANELTLLKNKVEIPEKKVVKSVSSNADFDTKRKETNTTANNITKDPSTSVQDLYFQKTTAELSNSFASNFRREKKDFRPQIIAKNSTSTIVENNQAKETHLSTQLGQKCRIERFDEVLSSDSSDDTTELLQQYKEEPKKRKRECLESTSSKRIRTSSPEINLRNEGKSIGFSPDLTNDVDSREDFTESDESVFQKSQPSPTQHEDHTALPLEKKISSPKVPIEDISPAGSIERSNNPVIKGIMKVKNSAEGKSESMSKNENEVRITKSVTFEDTTRTISLLESEVKKWKQIAEEKQSRLNSMVRDMDYIRERNMKLMKHLQEAVIYIQDGLPSKFMHDFNNQARDLTNRSKLPQNQVPHPIPPQNLPSIRPQNPQWKLAHNRVHNLPSNVHFSPYHPYQNHPNPATSAPHMNMYNIPRNQNSIANHNPAATHSANQINQGNPHAMPGHRTEVNPDRKMPNIPTQKPPSQNFPISDVRPIQANPDYTHYVNSNQTITSKDGEQTPSKHTGFQVNTYSITNESSKHLHSTQVGRPTTQPKTSAFSNTVSTNPTPIVKHRRSIFYNE